MAADARAEGYTASTARVVRVNPETNTETAIAMDRVQIPQSEWLSIRYYIVIRTDRQSLSRLRRQERR